MSTTDNKKAGFDTTVGKKSNGHKGKKAAKEALEAKKPGWSTTDEDDDLITLEYLIALPPFTESRDEGSSGDSFGARLPNYIARVITSLKENKATPYKINSDVVRDAIYVGLFILTKRYGGCGVMLTESALSQATDVASESRRLHIRFNAFVEELVFLSEHDDKQKAKDVFIGYINTISREERAWTKQRMISLIKSNSTTKSMLQECDDSIKAIVGMK